MKEACRPQDRPPDLIPLPETTPHDPNVLRPRDKTDFTKSDHAVSPTIPEINDRYTGFNRDPGFGHDCAQPTQHPTNEHDHAQTTRHPDFEHDHTQTARHPKSEYDPGPSSIGSAQTTRYAPPAHLLNDHDWGPTNVRVNTITIETANGGDYEDIMTKRELERYLAQVRTMYKRKDKKIRPANVPLPDGVNPGGGVN